MAKIAITPLPPSAWCPVLNSLRQALQREVPAGLRLALASAAARLVMGRPDRLEDRDLAALQLAGRMAAEGGSDAA